MFESAFDPFYTRKEQVQESDITFLQRLCKAAGISLKVTAKMIVLFDAAAYEKKSAVRTIKRGAADVKRYSFNTSLQVIGKHKAGNRTARFIIDRKRVKHGAKFHAGKEDILRGPLQGG